MIDLVVMVLTLLVGAVNWHNSPEKKQERDNHERDKEIINKDHIGKSKRLSDLVDD